MKIKKYFKYPTFENYLQGLVLSIPVLLISGPFLPDLFLSLSSISLLIYLTIKKEFNFFNHNIFYLFMIFFFILVTSSLFSDYKIKSLTTSLGYLRFGIFIFVVSFLINRKTNFIKYFFLLISTIYFVLFFDAIFQKLTGSNIFGIPAPYGRITSLFGEDIKLGGYIARVTPLFIGVSIYLKTNRVLIFLILISSLFLTLISGERTSFLMLIMFLIGYVMFSNIPIKLKFFYLIIPIALVLLAFTNQEIRFRILTSTLNQINIYNEKPFFKVSNLTDGKTVVLNRDSTILPRVYHMYFETVIKIFKDNYIIGSGPRTYPLKSKEKKYYTVSDHQGWLNFRKEHNEKIINKLYQLHKNQISKISKNKKFNDLIENKNLMENQDYADWLNSYGISSIDFEERLKDEKWLKENGYLKKDYPGFTNISGANSHPHNTYLQLLSETGVFGFLYIFLVWIYCVFMLFSKINFYYKCILLGLVVNLFPFMFSGNFFNGWLSILYFYPLGFLITEKH